MVKETNLIIEKKLNVVIELLQHFLALELSKSGVTQGVIAKRLHVAKATVGEMLEEVKKER